MFKEFNTILARDIILRRNLQALSSLREKIVSFPLYLTQPEEIYMISNKMKAR